VWTGPDAVNRGLFGQRFAANGARLGGEFQINAATGADEYFGDVAMNASGQFVVAWRGGDVDGSALYARRFDANGVALSGDIKVNSTDGFWEDPYPTVGLFDDGSFVIAWSSTGGQDGSGMSALVRRFDTNGTPLGAEFFAGSRTMGDQFYSTVAVLANGEFVVSWNEYDSRDGSGLGIYAQHYAANGTSIGSEFRVNSTIGGPNWIDQYWTFLGSNRDGRLVVVWAGQGAGDADGIFAQSYDLHAGTSEAGGSASYSLVLDAQPTANVTFSVSVSNAAEASVSLATITFTPGNWNIPQLVTLTGLQDYVQDGDTTYSLQFSAMTSADTAFNGVTAADVVVVNHQIPNTAPSISYSGGAVTVNEDTSVSFSSLGGNQIVLTDADAGSNLLQLSLSTANGVLNLASASGLSFVSGSNGSGAMVVRGSLANLNAALNGLSRSSNLNWNGVTTIQLDLDDLGNTGLGGSMLASRTISLNVQPVNDAPALTGSGSLSGILEDALGGTGTLVSTLVSGFVSDVDVASVSGIALYSVDGSYGTWQYTTDGSTWQSIGAVNSAASLLLAADANTAIRFIPDANFNGSAAIAYRAWDQTSGSAGTYADSTNQGASFAFSTAFGTSTLVVTSVNDAPTGTTQNRTINENSSFVFGLSDFGFTDPNDAASPNSFAGVRITSLPVAGSLLLSGSAVALNQIISAAQLGAGNLVFTPAANGNGIGYASLSFQVIDTGGTANGGVDTDSVSRLFSFDVMPVNSAPTIVSNTLTISEGATVVITNANISAQDVDNSASQLMLTVSGLSNGQFEYVGNAGVAISTFTQADIDAGLVQFVHDGSQLAPAYSLTVSDGLLTAGPQAATINYSAFNDAPAIGYAAGSVTMNEDSTLVFSLGNGNAIVVSDVDAGVALVRLSLSSTNGTLSLASLVGIGFVSGANGTNSMVLQGSLTNLNNALNGLAYSAAAEYNGIAAVSVLLDDLGNTGSGGPLTASLTVAVSVTAVNDAPVLLLPSVQTVTEDATLVLSGANRIQLADVDAASGLVQLSLSSGSGLLTLSGVTGLSFLSGDGVADGSMVIRGTVADLNAALDGMVFTPNANFNGATSLNISVDDLGNTGGPALTASAALSITVSAQNDAPVNTLPPAQSMLEDGVLVMGGANRIQVFDVESTTIRVSLSVSSGVLSLSGITGLSFLTGTGSNDTSVVFSGSLAAVNAALDGLTFQPAANFSGAVTLTVTSDDMGASGAPGQLTQTDFLPITVVAVNDAPAHSLPGPQTVNEDTMLVLSGANRIQISDADAGGNSVQLSLSVTTGSLTLAGLAGLTFLVGDGVNDSSMVLQGTVAAINAALDGMAFQAGANFNGAVTLALTTDDLGNTGGAALQASSSLSINVLAVNDAPTNLVPGPITMTEDSVLVFSGANQLQVADVDAGASVVRIQLNVSAGNLSLSSLTGLTFLTGSGSNDSSMVFEGSLSNINAALNGMSLVPPANFNGAITLNLISDDLGASGAPGPLSASSSVAISVAAVNDAPTQLVPGAQTTLEDTPLVFSGANLIQIADLDAGGSAVRVSLQVGAGSLSLSGIAGLTFQQGDGVSDGAMQFTGTLAAINAALNGLSYLPAANMNGADSLQITTEDLGNVGSGGNLLRMDQVAISVVAVNDAISVSGPSTLQIPEDTLAFVLSSGGQFFALQDVDATGFPVQIVVSVTIGQVQLATLTGVTVLAGDPAGAAMITLRGELTDINAALTSMRFVPPADFFGTARITVSADDLGGQPGSGPSALAQANLDVTVTAVNDAPVITLASTFFSVQQLGVSQSVANSVTIQDVDSAVMLQAVASISSGFEAGKDVLYLDTAQLDLATRSAITSNWDSASGQLVLTGSATTSQYASALSALRFTSTSVNPGQRTVSMAVGDGQTNSPLAKSIGSIQLGVTVTPNTPPTNSNPDTLPGGPTTTPNAPTPSTGANPTTSVTPSLPVSEPAAASIGQAEAETDLADRQRRSVRVDFDGVGVNAAAKVRAAKLMTGAADAAAILAVEVSLRADNGGELRFEDRGDQPWKLGGASKYTNSRTAPRFSESEEQRLVEEIARDSRASDTLHLEISAAQATSAGAAAFATLLLWTIRAGGIVAAIATSAPAWRNMDPLPLLLDEKSGGVGEPEWGDTEAPTVAAVAGSTMMEAQAVLERA
jgi:Cadherin-like/Bacterial Ig domain